MRWQLLLTAFHQHQQPGKKVLEQTLLFRSRIYPPYLRARLMWNTDLDTEAVLDDFFTKWSATWPPRAGTTNACSATWRASKRWCGWDNAASVRYHRRQPLGAGKLSIGKSLS